LIAILPTPKLAVEVGKQPFPPGVAQAGRSARQQPRAVTVRRGTLLPARRGLHESRIMPDKPLELRKLLVAADFSPPAEAALHRALSVARSFAAEITVCHVLQDIREAMAVMRREARWELVAGDIDKYEAALREDSEAKLEALLRPYQDGSASLRHETRVGAPYVQLIHAVEEQGRELLFVGTRGMTGLKRLVLGSTAHRLLRNCPAPVWVVKAEQVSPLKTILAATDFSEASGEALRLAAGLASRLGAELHVLHVVHAAGLLQTAQEQGYLEAVTAAEVDQEAEEHLREFATQHCGGAPVKLHVVRGQPSGSIVEVAQRLGADLTVLSTVGRSGLPGLLIGNTAEQVVDSLGCDVLAVKPKSFISPVLPALRVEAAPSGD
jgi:nucleotide-binding universal stress UspA family protein